MSSDYHFDVHGHDPCAWPTNHLLYNSISEEVRSSLVYGLSSLFNNNIFKFQR